MFAPKSSGARRLHIGWLGSFFILVLAIQAWAGSGGWIEFEDQTSQRLMADPGLGIDDPDEKDYAWGDIDQDGDTDIVCVRKQPFTTPGRRPNVLFMNEDGVFVDRTSTYAAESDVPGDQGFLTPTNDRDVALTDVTGDGWLDIVTVTTVSEGQPKHISHPRIYRNKGLVDGVWQGFLFEDARIPQIFTITNPHPVAPRFCSVGAGDIDNDGDVDLYFGDYDSAGVGGSIPEAPGDDVNDRLFINDGTGYFTDSLLSRMDANMLLSAFSMAAAIVDMNGDGLLDIVKDTALNFPQRVSVAYNDAANPGNFSALDIVYDFSPYHVVVGELNNDNRPDMVVTDDGPDRYMLNLGNGADGRANFSNEPFSFQPVGSDDGFGGDNFIVDLNNDGFNDVLITDVDVDIDGCSRRLHIYRNLGNVPNVTLQEQGGAAPWTPQGVHDLAIFDINGDGWNDLFMGTCQGTEIWINQPPVGINFSYLSGLPALIPPGVGATFQVRLTGIGSSQPLAGSAVFHLAIGDGAFVSIPMTPVGPPEQNTYEATFPPVNCSQTYRWYIGAMVGSGEEFFDPPAGAIAPYVATAANGTEITLRDEIEGDISGWTIVNEDLLAGAWEAVDPVGTLWVNQLAAPNDDATAAAEAVKAFITLNGAPGAPPSSSDVDGGPTRLVSPAIDLQGTDGTISWSQWFFCHNAGTPDGDALEIEVSNDDGQTWVLADSVTSTGNQWQVNSFRVSDFVVPSAQVRVRFSVDDRPNNSLTEAGIDNFQVQALICDQPLSIVSSNPPDGAIDARQPSNPDGTNPAGWSSVELTFNANASALTAADFDINVEPAGFIPNIGFVTPNGNTVTILFGDAIEEFIPVRSWTTITHIESGTSTRIGYLPGDVSGDGTSSPTDVLTLIDALNGISTLPIYSTDADRSGVAGPADILRVIDLLNGAGVYDAYNGVSLP